MKIVSINFRNFSSYGNKISSLDIPEDYSLISVLGQNGAGKCLLPSTKIEVKMKTEEEIKKFKEFLSIYRSKGYNGTGKLDN